MKLIVGLGNPGDEYARTRHNVGWRVMDSCVGALSFEQRFNAEVGRANGVVYCKPQTFMNLSGIAVRAVADYFHIAYEHIVLIYDDKDLPFGTIRLRSGGSSGGHNGVESIIAHLGTQDVNRIRIGIAPTHPIADTSTFVLSRFSAEEERNLPDVLTAVCKQITAFTSSEGHVPHQDITV